MALNKKYSYKNFMDEVLVGIPASDFNNSEIIGSCFYQQAGPDTKVFPNEMTGVAFQKCNLDNAAIPAGNIVESSCLHRRLMAQNDLETWVVDGSNVPVEPVNPKTFTEFGLSIDPADIPIVKLDEPITFTALRTSAVVE